MSTYLNDMVYVVFFSIGHIIWKHFNNVFDHKFSCSAKFQEKIIRMPWVNCNLIFNDPLFELLKAFGLCCWHISNVSIYKMTTRLELCLKVGGILFKIYTYPNYTTSFSFFFLLNIFSYSALLYSINIITFKFKL